MDHAVDIFDSFGEDTKFLKIINLDKLELVGVLGSLLDHCIPFGERSGGSADPKPPGQEYIYDVRTNESCSASD